MLKKNKLFFQNSFLLSNKNTNSSFFPFNNGLLIRSTNRLISFNYLIIINAYIFISYF